MTDVRRLEADIEHQRDELAHTVADLQAKLDVKTRAREKAQDLKDRTTTADGRPRPEVAAAAGAGVLVLLVARKARRARRARRMRKALGTAA